MTDNISLNFIQSLKFMSKSKLVRCSLILQNFDFENVHLRGKDNVVADFSSRHLIHIDQENPDSKPGLSSVQDIDHFHFLLNIDVHGVVRLGN
jgi:hypothetical protein